MILNKITPSKYWLNSLDSSLEANKQNSMKEQTVFDTTNEDKTWL